MSRMFGVSKSYPMTLPRLGNAVIINNVSSSMPGSEHDVTALKHAFQTVGFEVHVCRNCNDKEMNRIQTWLKANETHEYCNAFSLVMLCDGTDDGQLLDCNKKRFSSIIELTEEISGIMALHKKPKLILVQRCTGNSTADVKIPDLLRKDDVLISYTYVSKYRTCDGEDCGSNYLQILAQMLTEELGNKPIQSIFKEVQNLMKGQLILTDTTLMELVPFIAARDMEEIALIYMAMEAPTISNISDARKDNKKMMTFDILREWRNRTTENTKEKLIEVLLQSGKVDPRHLRKILEPDGQTPVKHVKQEHGWTQHMDLSEFPVLSAAFGQRGEKVLDANIRQKLEEKIKHLEGELNETKIEQKKKLEDLEKAKSAHHAKEIKHLNEELQKRKEELVKTKELLNMTLQKKDTEKNEVITRYEGEIKHVEAELRKAKESNKLEIDVERDKSMHYEQEIKRLNKELANTKELLDKTLEKDKEKNELITHYEAEIRRLEIKPKKAEESHRKKEVILVRRKTIELDLISSHDINLEFIYDMTVMRETGLIAVITLGGSLFQFSLQEGRLIEQEIKPPCKHNVYLLCIQVAEREYLALSCQKCEDIKLMDLNKQLLNSDSQIQYEVITAFSGQWVERMCRREERRLFVGSGYDVLELNTSTTTFTKVRTIRTSSLGYLYDLCYVPDPHRLLVVSRRGEVRAVACDDNKVVWRIEDSEDFNPGHSLYVPRYDVLFVADRRRNKLNIVKPAMGENVKYINLPDHVCHVGGLCWFKDQIVVSSRDQNTDKSTISFFCLKKN